MVSLPIGDKDADGEDPQGLLQGLVGKLRGWMPPGEILDLKQAIKDKIAVLDLRRLICFH